MLRTPSGPIYTQLPEFRRRCTSTRIHHGKVVRCHDVEGHKSVHYTKETWWPDEPRINWKIWLSLLIAACLFTALILWIMGVRP